MNPTHFDLTFPANQHKYVLSGTRLHYPFYNSEELDYLDKRRLDTERMDLKNGGKFNVPNSTKITSQIKNKALKSVGGNIKDTVNKSKIARKTKNVLKNHVLPIAKDVAVEVAKDVVKGMIEQQTGGTIKKIIKQSKIGIKDIGH